MYDHTQPTKHTAQECEAAVGKTATLVLTGKIVEARESDSGPFVMFAPDDRFGLDTRLGFDLDALAVDD